MNDHQSHSFHSTRPTQFPFNGEQLQQHNTPPTPPLAKDDKLSKEREGILAEAKRIAKNKTSRKNGILVECFIMVVVAIVMLCHHPATRYEGEGSLSRRFVQLEFVLCDLSLFSVKINK